MANTATNQNVKYPYPSTLNVGNFVSIKLTQTNYLLWRTQILGLIESQELTGFINGEAVAPLEMIVAPDSSSATGEKMIVNPDFVAWRRSDRLLRGWITGTLNEDVLSLVVGLESSKEVWNTLHDAYAQDSQEREFHLTQKLQMLRKGTSSLSDYIRVFKNICDDLAAIGKPLDDKKKVFWLLNGLGVEYKSFITTMLKPPTPSYKEIIPLLQSHETWISTHETQQPNNQTVAFVTQRGRGSPNRGRYNNFSSRGRGFTQMSHMDKGNYIPNQPPTGKNPNKKSELNISKNGGKFFDSGSLPTCQICEKRGHVALKCWYRFNQSFAPDDVPQALAAMTISDSQDHAWYPDTGASTHMTGDPGQEQRDHHDGRQ
ncbi:hypothetical protein HHK36_023341 [Tetracentron sinense]|uniref:Retrotransposon Copia-like N-terminal domain-containing protein n=1 Tax=Tetracentron sinense TaxID=13715 RepID=A0A834YSZ7_TETSI|nr:hypothetical protein HHK36_023341 [Tetracentron sinense]